MMNGIREAIMMSPNNQPAPNKIIICISPSKNRNFDILNSTF